MAASTPSTVFTAMMASRYSVDQSCSLAGFTRGIGLLRRRVAAHLAAGLEQRRRSAPADGRRAPCASTSSVSVAPQTPVRRILALTTMRLGHGQVGAAVDVGVADALQVREHRHARLLLHARRPGSCRRAARSRRWQPSRPFSISPTASRSVVGTSWMAASGRPAARRPRARHTWMARLE